MKNKFVGFLIFIPVLFFSQNESDTSEDCNSFKRNRINPFGITSIENRIVDNKGDGNKDLYGTRNFRAVLYNLVYRGGGNNFHLKDTIPKYYLWNPMPLYGINALKQSGFDQAVYLYSYNFDYWYPKKRIDSLQRNGFTYKCEPKLKNYLKTYFKEVVAHANDSTAGYIYIHCWNGWHQSGLLSAYTLMQFCDFTNLEALKYWEKCTDGHFKGYKKVKDKIKAYKLLKEYSFSDNQKKKHCPCKRKYVPLKKIQEKDKINLSEDEMMQLKKKITYIVKPGDSLSKIARYYKVNVSEIKQLNQLKSDVIKVNQLLIIPNFK